MGHAQNGSFSERPATNSASHRDHQPSVSDEPQNQPAAESQSASINSAAQRDVDVSTIGQFGVDVGGGETVLVPNPFGRSPAREEIYQALVTAGHRERAEELADKAYRDVSGADCEDDSKEEDERRV